MKTNRNDACPCGSGEKYKNCCEKKRFQPGDKNRLIRWLIRGAVGFFLAIIAWELVEHYSTDLPEKDYYRCGNPNCTIWHERPKAVNN